MTVSNMTAKDIAQKVFNKDPLFILDVRKEEAFSDWKIEGENFEHLNIPYSEVEEKLDQVLESLPLDKEIVVTCAKEKSAKLVSELLAEKGREVPYLAGGMKAWSEHLEIVKVGDLHQGGEVYQFVRIGKGCLSYMILSDGEAAIIDPTRMTDVFIDFAREKGVKITHVLDTHLHADHISGGREISRKTQASYYLPPKDAEEVVFDYTPLQDGDILKIGHSKIEIKAYHTPGHTSGSTSFIVDQNYLFTGDLLFIDSIGRPDLAGKAKDWVDDLRETLYVTYKKFPKDLLVLPAHFMIIEELNDDGTVSEKLGRLFEKNHGLNITDEEEFASLVTEGLPPQPNSFKDIRQVNMGKIEVSEEEQREMEIGPNRCAVR